MFLGGKYSEASGEDRSISSGKHDKEKGKYGSDTSELHSGLDEEKGAKKHKHYHADKHESFHKSGGESAHGAKFEEASNRHKGNYKKVLVFAPKIATNNCYTGVYNRATGKNSIKTN